MKSFLLDDWSPDVFFQKYAFDRHLAHHKEDSGAYLTGESVTTFSNDKSLGNQLYQRIYVARVVLVDE